jgi:hypothetical protein
LWLNSFKAATVLCGYRTDIILESHYSGTGTAGCSGQKQDQSHTGAEGSSRQIGGILWQIPGQRQVLVNLVNNYWVHCILKLTLSLLSKPYGNCHAGVKIKQAFFIVRPVRIIAKSVFFF